MSESNNNTPMRITQLEEATAYEDGMYYAVAKAGGGTKKIDANIWAWCIGAYSSEKIVIPSSYYVNSNTILTQSGETTTINGYSTTAFIPILVDNCEFSGNGFPNNTYNTFCLYDAELNLLYSGKRSFIVSLSDYPTAKYFRASTENLEFFVEVRTFKIDETARERIIFNGSLLLEDFYSAKNTILNGSGTDVSSNNNFKTTQYIEIPYSDAYFQGDGFPNQFFNTFCLYNDEFEVLYQGKNTFNVSLKDYPTAKYFRASMSNDGMYRVTAGIESGDNKIYEVGSDKEFTTLRAGVAEAIKHQNAKVVVYAGTYDLTQEFATEIANQTGSGIKLANGVHVEFMSGAYVKALFPISNNWISQYFEPFYGYNFTLENANIESSNCRYCVHDERSGNTVTYKNVYKNCIMKHSTDKAGSGITGDTWHACIGIGFGSNGIIIIEGGKYTADGDSDPHGECPPISAHNANNVNADNKLIIKDVYIDGTDGQFRFGYYGTSTKKSPILVSGCSMGGNIILRPETQSSTVVNFELTEWNNTIRQS